MKLKHYHLRIVNMTKEVTNYLLAYKNMKIIQIIGALIVVGSVFAMELDLRIVLAKILKQYKH